MNLSQKIEYWGDSHHPLWLDYIRIALGLFLIAKGVFFISDTESVRHLLTSTSFEPVAWAAVHYIVFCHLIGGFFILIGLLTRYAAAFQIPILISAIAFVHIRSTLPLLNSELWVAIIVLVLLIVFLIVGSGNYSYDEKLRTNKNL